jgi:hypothetical protein
MKAIKFKHGDKIIEAKLHSKVDKKSLYGYARRCIEKDGRVLSRGILCPDGVVLTRDEVASTDVDPEGSPVEEVITECDGKPIAIQPSSFDQENSLDEVPLKNLVGFNVTDVYPVEDIGVKPGLYQTSFSYRKACFLKEAFVLVCEADAFLLVGRMKAATFVGLNVAYEFFDSESATTDDSEELDFSMV